MIDAQSWRENLCRKLSDLNTEHLARTVRLKARYLADLAVLTNPQLRNLRNLRYDADLIELELDHAHLRWQASRHAVQGALKLAKWTEDVGPTKSTTSDLA